MDIHSPLGILGPNKNQLFESMDERQVCIQNCVHCHLICRQMVQHSLQMGGVYAEASHVRLFEDCSEICEVTADFMLRESNHYRKLCAVCIEACDATSERCRRFPEDTRMAACAAACEETSRVCKQMIETH